MNNHRLRIITQGHPELMQDVKRGRGLIMFTPP